MHAYVWTLTEAKRGQEHHGDESQVVVSLPMEALATELKSSERAASTPNQ